VPVLDPNDIFRTCSKRGADSIRPECGGAEQDPDTDTADVGTCDMRPFAYEKLAQDKFDNDAGGNCQQRLLIAFENAKT